MTPPTLLRKPKLHFDTTPNPSHVSFDDGKGMHRLIPWPHLVEARWEYVAEPDVVKIEIGEWLMVIRGHNLGPLFVAVEEKTLLRVRAQPELGQEREREIDTYVTEVRFTKPPPGGLGVKRGGQVEFDLGG